MVRRRMILLWIAGLLVAGLGTAYVASPDVRYVARAGMEEQRLLRNARPLEKIVRDPKASPEARATAELVLQVRHFADTLGYAAKDTYTTYSDVGRDTLLLSLSASRKDCICPYEWQWPIVGKVPYKGFFDAKDGLKAKAEFDAKGYDTYLRPAAAFSTLGWFKDPLLSTAVSKDSVELAALVFHEIAHNTLYVPSATAFNESFAQYAGYRAAEQFFLAHGDSVKARRAADRWHDEQILGEYYRQLVARLDTLYASKPDSAALVAGRLAAGEWVKVTLEGWVKDSVRTFQIGPVAARSVNNAALVGVRIYRTELPLFEAWHRRHGGDVAAAVAALRTLLDGARGDEAFGRLRSALSDSAGAAPAPAAVGAAAPAPEPGSSRAPAPAGAEPAVATLSRADAAFLDADSSSSPAGVRRLVERPTWAY